MYGRIRLVDLLTEWVYNGGLFLGVGELRLRWKAAIPHSAWRMCWAWMRIWETV